MALMAAGAPAPAVAATCDAGPDFACQTLTVPLDRTDPASATLDLRYAVQRRPASVKGVLVALLGGPGQSGLPFASDYEQALAPMLRTRRLVLIDQRGTGRSGVLRCPALQKRGTFAPTVPSLIGECGAALGAGAGAYGTADTVLDLETLRQRLGPRRIALFGVSYGTYVAEQYARTFPDRVQRLILDSTLPPDGPTLFDTDIYGHSARVLGNECTPRCRALGIDPVTDTAAVVSQLTQGDLVGQAPTLHGRRRPTALNTPGQLATMLVSGDFSAALRAALPAALHAAALGDSRALLRLRRLTDEPPFTTEELSIGLYSATTCADMTAPYTLATAIEDRPAAEDAALAGLDPSAIYPFDPPGARELSAAEYCRLWPQAVARPRATGPLPDVPALIFGGQFDMRTPLENAVAVSAQLPQSHVVAVPAEGHAVVGADASPCVLNAIRRFAQGATPSGCRLAVSLFPTLGVDPVTLAQAARAPGMTGRRGRLVGAIIDTVTDADNAASIALDSQLASAGGLAGGVASWTATGLQLSRYGLLPDARLSGQLHFPAGGGTISGRLAVFGRNGRRMGSLRLTRHGTVTGTLDGHRVLVGGRHRLPLTAAAAGAAAGPVLPTGSAATQRERVAPRSGAAARIARSAPLG
jgi:pimeloyl-ACP methyl ester carboxylesterase